MVHHGFAMSWWATLLGAWWVLRANQAWAPVPNDPDRARQLMTKFYQLVVSQHGEPLDAGRAAELEVAWWAAHRRLQRGDNVAAAAAREQLVAGLAELYAYCYRVPSESVRRAAELRTCAMETSDAWVAAGCNRSDPALISEEADLVASYGALMAAVS